MYLVTDRSYPPCCHGLLFSTWEGNPGSSFSPEYNEVVRNLTTHCPPFWHLYPDTEERVSHGKAKVSQRHSTWDMSRRGASLNPQVGWAGWQHAHKAPWWFLKPFSFSWLPSVVTPLLNPRISLPVQIRDLMILFVDYPGAFVLPPATPSRSTNLSLSLF